MMGTWLRFGEGAPPEEEEALVYIRDGQAPTDASLRGLCLAKATLAIYRGGKLFEQRGAILDRLPVGNWWTSLPRPPNQVE
jgi:hypothetical protein